jgi:hypothetical protein
MSKRKTNGADKTLSESAAALRPGITERVRRYAALRAAQRALYPIRSLPGRLHAEETLQRAREQLQAIGPDPQAAKAEVDETALAQRESALREVDGMLSDVARELRSVASQVSFSELRAALPLIRETRPQEVAALLDLCLGEEPEGAPLLSVIDYLATLLSTSYRGSERVLGSDPVSVTPSLRDRCEEQTQFDPGQVAGYVEAFDAAIVGLSQAESVDPVIARARELKARVGPLMFVPELFRKIVEYNIVAANRLDDGLEAERTLHEIEIEIETLATLESVRAGIQPDETPPTEETPPTSDDETPELRDAETLRGIAHALAEVVRGNPVPDGAHGEIAAALEVSVLSPWERLAFTCETRGDEEALIQTVAVVGLLLRKPDENRESLEGVGLTVERLESEWVPMLDLQTQRAIATHIIGCEHTEAKRLSQTRAKFLYRILEAQRRARAAESPATEGAPRARAAEVIRIDAPFEPDSETRQPSRRPLLIEEARRTAMPVLAAALVASLVLAILLQLYQQKGLRSVALISPALLAEISPHLESGYRDRLGYGPRFFGRVKTSWQRMHEDDARDEATRIGKFLRWTGVEEVQLFDNANRWVVWSVGDELLVPRAKEKAGRQ